MDRSAMAPDDSSRAREMAMGLARQASPLRAGQSWWVIGIEAIAAIVIGIFALVQPGTAAGIIRQLIAVVLLLASAGQIAAGFRFRELAASPWATLRGGVGLTAAALVLLSLLSTFIPAEGARQILAVGLIAYGVLGVAAAFFTREDAAIRWGALVGDAMVIVVGFLMLTQTVGDAGTAQLIGWVLLIGGVALLVIAFLAWRKHQESGA